MANRSIAIIFYIFDILSSLPSFLVTLGVMECTRWVVYFSSLFSFFALLKAAG